MTPVQQLKELYLQDSRERHPLLPEYARCAPKYNPRTANGLTKMILDFLRLKHWQCERISVTGRYVDKSKIFTDVAGFQRRIGSGQWIRPSMQPGTADLSAVINGRAVKIEIKVGKDRQSEAQKRYQDEVTRAGGIYLLIHSYTEFLTWYNEMEARND
jgi:hypothetical protein